MPHRQAGFWTKFGRFSWEERFALAEATILLTVSAPLIRHAALPRLGRIASRPLPRPLPPGPRRRDLAEIIAWAVDRAAKRSRLRALCFERGLTAQVMLRRRGVDLDAVLWDPPRFDDAARCACLGSRSGFDVTGTPPDGGYAILASFPPGREASGFRPC
ncbi:lasso peptide biosynthesis protein [Sphingomonas aerolata]|uniref:lasso peptide biosynthesis protein n=1 Tax=Sphingomonas aerolata TaxID=185951 RepID=UPI002FE11315